VSDAGSDTILKGLILKRAKKMRFTAVIKLVKKIATNKRQTFVCGYLLTKYDFTLL